MAERSWVCACEMCVLWERRGVEGGGARARERQRTVYLKGVTRVWWWAGVCEQNTVFFTSPNPLKSDASQFVVRRNPGEWRFFAFRRADDATHFFSAGPEGFHQHGQREGNACSGSASRAPEAAQPAGISTSPRTADTVTWQPCDPPRRTCHLS